MSPKLEFGCLPTAIGSMPHVDAQEACRLVLRYLPAIPAWPQLPKRSFREIMYAQFSQGFPGITIEIEEEQIYVNRSKDLDPALEKLYHAYLERDTTDYTISPEYAAGRQTFLTSEINR